MTGGVLEYFARHKTAANLLLVMLLAIGVAILPRLRAQFFPDVIVDNITVSVVWDGAGADDVDNAIVQLLEPALLAVDGVESSYSTAREGRASIELDFEPGWDMDQAADDVQSAVDQISNLPENAEDPVVRRGAWRDRVTDVVIHGPVGVDQLARFTDEFVARLFVDGVTRTTIRGIAAPETVIEVTTASLIEHDVTMAEIADAIAAGATTDPVGDVEGANARVRTGTAKTQASDIAAIVLRSSPEMGELTIGDVGRLYQTGVDRDRAYFVGANPAISVRVDRNDKGDAIDIQAQVADIAATYQESLPPGVELDLIRTRSEAITGRLNILLDNGLVGLGLVLILLFLFLNLQTAIWVAAGIPVSMLAALALMYAGGLTINMISLFALIITLGIVVDDAIVVGEHADFRARHRGESATDAAVNAARRMAAPVFSATMTTVIAFFGLIAIGGRFGDLIADIPFTVIAVLMASLVECFLILPNHMAHALRHADKQYWYDWPSRQVNRGLDWFRRVVFRPAISVVVAARYPVLAATIALLLSQAALFMSGDVTWRFFNSPEQGSVSGNFAMLPGATRDDTLAMMRETQRAADAVAARYEAEYGTNPLLFVMTEIGGGSGRGLAGAENKEADLLGSISIEMIDADLRPYSSFRFVADLQDEVRNHPMLEAISFRGWRSGPGGDALDVQIFGAETQVLKDAAEALKSAVAQYPEVSAVEDSLSYDKTELIMDLTPQGAALGFTIDGIGRVLRNRLNGIEAATYPDGVRSGAIRVELASSEKTADFLDRMQLRSPSGDYLPLSDLVSVRFSQGFSTIIRETGLRTVSVTGDISEDDPTRAAEIMTELTEVILPDLEERFGVNTRLSGLAEQERDFLSDATLGFGLCLVGIYLILAWIFSSWTRPMVVMAIIPFGLVGTIWGHYIWDVPLSMFTVVGLIGMTGIIINDSIVLVTTIDEYAQDRGLIPAIIDGTSDRLRPVLLTTLTTVLGLAPLLFEGSAQAQFLKPTVITLVYGLGFGMVIVLLVVPAFLAMQRDVALQTGAARKLLRGRHDSHGAGWTVRALSAAMLAWFAATMGATFVNGALPGLFSVTGLTGMAGALGLFISGTAVILFLAWLGGAIAHGATRRQA